jgi:hypothetical protein
VIVVSDAGPLIYLAGAGCAPPFQGLEGVPTRAAPPLQGPKRLASCAFASSKSWIVRRRLCVRRSRC